MLQRLRCWLRHHEWKPEEGNRYRCTRCGARLRLGRGDRNFHAEGGLLGHGDIGGGGE